METSLEHLSERVQYLEDLESIRHTWRDYCMRLDSGDSEGVGDVFTEDGVLETVGLEVIRPGADGVYRGRTAIINDFYFRGARGSRRPRTELFSTGHLSTNMQIDLKGEEAGVVLLSSLALEVEREDAPRREPVADPLRPDRDEDDSRIVFERRDVLRPGEDEDVGPDVEEPVAAVHRLEVVEVLRAPVVDDGRLLPRAVNSEEEAREVRDVVELERGSGPEDRGAQAALNLLPVWECSSDPQPSYAARRARARSSSEGQAISNSASPYFTLPLSFFASGRWFFGVRKSASPPVVGATARAPAAIASRTGRPKPSASVGKTKTSAVP